MKIGFIGTGVMGTGIILNLLKANHQVTVYNRTKAQAQTVLDAGANWADSPAAAAQNAEVTISMVGFPKDVEEIYFGDQGILAGAQPQTIVVDMTTSTPALAIKIAEAAHQNNSLSLDAPVSGGDIGAQNGTLTVMAGGDKPAFDFLSPLFAAIAQRVSYFGKDGSGQHTKMANQTMIAGTMT